MADFVNAPGPAALKGGEPEFVDAPGPKAVKQAAPEFVDAPGPVHPPGPPIVPPIVPSVPATRYGDYFEQTSKASGVPIEVLRSIHAIEDPSDDPFAVSSSGAVGEMQMMPATFKEYSKPGDKITDPQKNIEASGNYLKYLTKHYNGDVEKVFAAYNAGPGNVDRGFKANDRYVKQAEANLASLTQSVEPVRALSKGTPPVVKAAAPQKEVASKPSRAQNDASFVDTIQDNADKAAEAIYKLPGKGVSLAYDRLGASQKEFLAQLAASGPVKEVVTKGRFVGGIADLPIEFINAAMRDMAIGGTANIGAVGSALWNGLTQHPQALGDVFDRLAQHYGENRKEEIMFWATRPGIIDQVKSIRPSTIPGQELQLLSAMHADVARGLLTHPGLRDLMTAIVEFVNPGNLAPGLLLHGLGAAVKGSAKAVAAGIDRIPKGREFVNKANVPAEEWLHATYTTMPMGDRFHMTKVAAERMGENPAAAAGEHHALASAQARAQEQVFRMFNQADKLAGTSLSQRKKILREHDRFFNEHETAHVLQPNGGDPIFDPITQTTVMTKGGFHGEYSDHVNHVFVSHGLPRLEIMRGTEAETVLGQKALKWAEALGQGKYAEALQLHPSISSQEAEAFEEAIRANPASHDPRAGRSWMKNQATLRLLSAHATKAGVDAINWGDNVVFSSRMKALQRDTAMAGGVSIHDRAFYTAQAVRMLDDSLRRIAPSAAKHLLEGYWPRSGMFQEESTIEEVAAMERSAGGMDRQGGTGLSPGVPKRKFKSIREAEAPAPFGGGLTENPNFDPGASMVKAMTRSLRYQNHAQYLLKRAKPINYDAVVKKSGVAFTVNTQFTEAGGKLGRREFDAMVSAEAQARVKARLTQAQYDAFGDAQSKPKLDAMVKSEAANIYKQVQESWELRNPHMTWNTAEQTGVDDLYGMTVPKHVRDSAVDSHPAFEKTKDRSIMSMIVHEDTPDQQLMNAVESTLHLARTSFLTDVTYHAGHNLAFIGLVLGHLNPIDIAQTLFLPNTISKKVLEEAEYNGAFAPGYGHGVKGQRASARYGFAAPEEPLERNLIKRNTVDLPKRIKNTYTAYKNAVDDAPGWHVPQHILGRAAYQADKWNQDLTFKMWEDSIAAVTWDKFVKRGMTPAQAGRETRKILGDTQNMTKLEKALALNKFEWFYSWFKGQMRLWSANYANPKVVGANNAVTDTLQSHDENDPSVTNPTELADRGQYVFHTENGPYTITLAPPPTRKLNAINSLVSTPFTQGQGALDFAQFVVSDLAHSLNPVARTIFESLPEAFNAKTVGSETLGDVGAQALGGVAQTFTPPQITAIQHGMKDHIRYLELLSVPVVNQDQRAGARVQAIRAKEYESRLNALLQRAGSESEKTALKEQYTPLINAARRQQQEDYGR